MLIVAKFHAINLIRNYKGISKFRIIHLIHNDITGGKDNVRPIDITFLIRKRYIADKNVTNNAI